MKTLTEFPGINLKNTKKIKQDLVASGKTPEELPQAMGEALKLEGERLNSLLAALELVEGNTEDLKRVVGYTLAEGEKAPPHVAQKGDHYYLVEYYPSLKKPTRGGPQDAPDERGRGKGKIVARLERRMKFSLARSEGEIYLTVGDQTSQTVLARPLA